MLGNVDELAAAIIALARIPFRILVRHDRALRLENGARHDVFRSDKLDLGLLPAKLALDCIQNIRIAVRQPVREKAGEVASPCCGIA